MGIPGVFNFGLRFEAMADILQVRVTGAELVSSRRASGLNPSGASFSNCQVMFSFQLSPNMTRASAELTMKAIIGHAIMRVSCPRPEGATCYFGEEDGTAAIRIGWSSLNHSQALELCNRLEDVCAEMGASC
jgi:hypothetical protein